MRCVLDCSVAIKWFVAEADSGLAERCLIDQQEGRLAFVAPDILVPELTGTLNKHVARRTLAAGEARYALAEFLSMPIEVVSSETLARDALDLAIGYSGTLFDALYVALAVRQDLRLLTADANMARTFASLDRTLLIEAYRG